MATLRPLSSSPLRKHGVPDEDILHAYDYPIRVLLLDELHMLIDPDRTGNLLEVGVSHAEGIEFIVHAMQARPKFIR